MSFYFVINLLILLTIFTCSTFALCPLCKQIKSQQFAQINLQSVTYQSDDQIFIFANDIKYTATFNDSSQSMDLLPDYSYWNQGFPIERVWSQTFGSMESVYLIESHNQVALGVVTNSTEYTWSLSGKKTKLISKSEKEEPDYAIVHNRVKDKTHGYIINKGKCFVGLF